MEYRLKYPFVKGVYRADSKVWSRDGVVTEATPAMAWLVGKSVSTMIYFAEAKGLALKVVGAGTRRAG